MCCNNYTREFINNNHILTRFFKPVCVEMRSLGARKMSGFVTEIEKYLSCIGILCIRLDIFMYDE